MHDLNNSVLLTDLYELTMAQAYFREEMFAPATFSLFIRAYPPNRGYFVNAGLERVLSFLERMVFDQSYLDYFLDIGLFDEDFLAYLSELKFSGDIFAIPEEALLTPVMRGGKRLRPSEPQCCKSRRASEPRRQG